MGLDQDLELPAEARALLDAVVAIGSDLDLRGVLTRIVEASCELTDAEYGVLGIVDDEGEFIDLLKADPEVRPHLTDAELEDLFDLGYHFKHVDTVFDRVFGKG